MFDAQGRSIFSGGITGARGHLGENLGFNLVRELAGGGHPDPRRTPVFGCALHEAACAKKTMRSPPLPFASSAPRARRRRDRSAVRRVPEGAAGPHRRFLRQVSGGAVAGDDRARPDDLAPDLGRPDERPPCSRPGGHSPRRRAGAVSGLARLPSPGRNGDPPHHSSSADADLGAADSPHRRPDRDAFPCLRIPRDPGALSRRAGLRHRHDRRLSRSHAAGLFLARIGVRGPLRDDLAVAGARRVGAV